MSLNFDKQGEEIAIIKGGKFKTKTVSLLKDPESEKLDEQDIKNYQGIKIPPNDVGHFQVLPKAKGRECIYITGASGSGKSYFVKMYCKEYKRKFPDNEIYLFSTIDQDESLDEIKPKRVIMDDTLISDPISVEHDLKNSAVIFDDIDSMQDKKKRAAVMKVLDEALQTGRHWNCTVILTFHTPSDRNATRMMLNECSHFVFFPLNAITKPMKYVLENYIGIDGQQFKKIKKLKSRWVCILKNFPQVIITEKNCFMLNELIDNEDSE